MGKLEQTLASFVADRHDTKGKVLGASLVVVNKDGILYEGSAGRIGHSEQSTPFSSRSCGWIASMTKAVTAVAALQAVERGLIALDDDVRPLIPELAVAKILRGFDKSGKPLLEDNIRSITLRQLLAHTSGLPYQMADPNVRKWAESTGRTANDLSQTREGWSIPLTFEPGSAWTYGCGLDWAGLVVEEVTGQRLGTFMADNIFALLGMDNTSFHLDTLKTRLEDHIIEFTHRMPDGTLTPGPLPSPTNPPVDSGGSGLFSTAEDYAKFLQGVLASSRGECTLLRQESVDEMFRPQLSETQRQAMESMLQGNLPFSTNVKLDHGLSGVINTEHMEAKRRAGTLSWGGMSNPQWWIDPATGIGAVFFVNYLSQDTNIIRAFYDEIERVVYQDLVNV